MTVFIELVNFQAIYYSIFFHIPARDFFVHNLIKRVLPQIEEIYQVNIVSNELRRKHQEHSRQLLDYFSSATFQNSHLQI